MIRAFRTTQNLGSATTKTLTLISCFIILCNDTKGQVYEACVEATAYVNERRPDEYVGESLWAGNEYQSGQLWELVALAQFDISCIPSGLPVERADIWLKIKSYTTNDPAHCSMAASQITSPWNPGFVTWNTRPTWDAPNSYFVYMADYEDEQWLSINVTQIVSAWVDGTPNHGVALHLITQGSPPNYNKYRFGTGLRETARIVINGAPGEPPPIGPIDFEINGGAPVTYDRAVVLNVSFDCACDPMRYRASEDPSFSDTSWQYYSGSPGAHPFTLSEGAGAKTVYYQVKNDWGPQFGEDISGIVTDGIEYAPPAVLVTDQCFVTPSEASPGDELTFHYRLHNRHSTTVQVGLGASIKPP